MSKKVRRIVISAVVLLGALTFFIYTAASENVQYYKHVDEVMANPQQWYGKNLQLHGFVDGDVLIRPGTLDYRFNVKNGDAVVRASYTGVVPDTFKTGSEVVVSGRLETDGFHVERNGVMAKCPSKYEPAGK